MIATLISIFIALAVTLFPLTVEEPGWAGLKLFMIAISTGFIFLIPLGFMFAWAPLQKSGQYSTPKIFKLFPGDRYFKIIAAYLVIFAFISLIFIADLELKSLYVPWILPLWIISFGLAVDSIRYFVARIMVYLNPYEIVRLFAANARSSIDNDKELEVCDWIDGISEIALKAINRHSTSLSHDALEEEQLIIRDFLATSKSIGHFQQDAQNKALGINDRVSFVMFHFYQRVDVAFDRALENTLEMTTSHIIRLMGKIVLDAAKYDITMATVPLRFLGKFARKAQEKGLEESTMTASCVLSEVASELVNGLDLTYAEIQDPFLSIINGLEVITKGQFQRDKNIKISILETPFKELKVLFEQDKMKNHQDTPVIMQNINRVLGEYEALQLVMTTRPPIPSVPDSA